LHVITQLIIFIKPFYRIKLLLHDCSTMLCVPTVAERDAALKQNESASRELSQLRESSAVLQQQLHVMTLEKQSEAEKSAKVVEPSTLAMWESLFADNVLKHRRCTCVGMTCKLSISQ